MKQYPAYWTHDDDAVAGHLYYFAPLHRRPPPYTKQREVTAIIDIADDGSLAGIELIDGMPPPPTGKAVLISDMRPIQPMSDAEIDAEEAAMIERWNTLEREGREGSGSPGEWIIERLDEIATEKARRRTPMSAAGLEMLAAKDAEIERLLNLISSMRNAAGNIDVFAGRAFAPYEKRDPVQNDMAGWAPPDTDEQTEREPSK